MGRRTNKQIQEDNLRIFNQQKSLEELKQQCHDKLVDKHNKLKEDVTGFISSSNKNNVPISDVDFELYTDEFLTMKQQLEEAKQVNIQLAKDLLLKQNECNEKEQKIIAFKDNYNKKFRKNILVKISIDDNDNLSWDELVL